MPLSWPFRFALPLCPVWCGPFAFESAKIRVEEPSLSWESTATSAASMRDSSGGQGMSAADSAFWPLASKIANLWNSITISVCNVCTAQSCFIYKSSSQGLTQHCAQNQTGNVTNFSSVLCYQTELHAESRSELFLRTADKGGTVILAGSRLHCASRRMLVKD